QRLRLWFRFHPVNGDCARLGAAVEADATAGAVLAGVVCGMSPVSVQLRPEFQALGRTGLHTESASLTFFNIDRDFTAWLACHRSPLCRGSDRNTTYPSTLY